MEIEKRKPNVKKSNTIFVLLVSALAAIYGIVSSILFIRTFLTDQTYPILLYLGFIVWFCGVFLSVTCLIVGSFIFIKSGKVINYFLFPYITLSCLTFKVYNMIFTWFILRIDFTVGISKKNLEFRLKEHVVNGVWCAFCNDSFHFFCCSKQRKNRADLRMKVLDISSQILYD